MSFEHRKYHWLYFVLGICLAVILAVMLGGCEQASTGSGVIKEEPPVCWDCPPEPPIACCAALMPECEACKDGCTVDEWMLKTCGENAIGVEYGYWDEVNNEPVWLCESVIID